MPINDWLDAIVNYFSYGLFSRSRYQITRSRALQQDLISNARQVIVDETAAIQALLERIDDNFAEACQSILKCEGRVIVTGMGKSGHIGHKIAATLASTGTPAFFVHPSEALHGDLGMITAADVVIPISNSGTTVELVTLCSVVKNQGTQLIAMTGNPDSILAKFVALSH
ncbi:arabinose 5-phosphate isomerase KdsD-like [Oratosquilla oratoria]|uniref:arabinose 5-phosphate isomerase KdsD-like n=1 Tax=Oratosquilla oratoria TaxID=337810 RepID=UPI003F77619D